MTRFQPLPSQVLWISVTTAHTGTCVFRPFLTAQRPSSPISGKWLLRDCTVRIPPSCLGASRTGLQAEKAMFRATGGVNTHKGMIFSMGLLAAAARISVQQAALEGRISGQLPPSASGEWDLSVPNLLSLAGGLCREETERDFEALNKRAESRGEDLLCLSHGERLYLKYGCRGIRGEAADGFPSLSQIACPALTGAAAYAGLLRPFPSQPSRPRTRSLTAGPRLSTTADWTGKWNLVRLRPFFT